MVGIAGGLAAAQLCEVEGLRGGFLDAKMMVGMRNRVSAEMNELLEGGELVLHWSAFCVNRACCAVLCLFFRRGPLIFRHRATPLEKAECCFQETG